MSDFLVIGQADDQASPGHQPAAEIFPAVCLMNKTASLSNKYVKGLAFIEGMHVCTYQAKVKY